MLPGADLLGRLGLQLGQVVGESIPGGQHGVRDLLVRRRRDLLARLGRESFDLADALREARVEHVLVGAAGAEGVDLPAHALDDETRRHQAPLDARLHRRDHLVDRGAEAREPRDVVRRVARVEERVHVQHEVGQRHLHAVELIERVVVEQERLAIDVDLQEPVEHLRGEALARRLRLGRVGAEHAQVVARELGLLLGEGDREVVEALVVGADAVALEHA